MTIIEFKKILDTNMIWHHYDNINGMDIIWVYGRNPSVYKADVYVPYLRVSHFDESDTVWYTRDCGICEYRDLDWILKRCFELKEKGV